ncbi:MAG: phosphoribosyltransferase family protein [Chloroflexi bacterium]|nr:phosphoribosyltransferase family protein [Chloroflexota bacterium]
MDLEPRFSEDEIREAVARIARAIEDDAPRRRSQQPLLLVGVLKGSFVLLADLVRELTIPAEVDFVRARSYGAGTTSTGNVEITKDLETDVADRDVIVVEDIAETGRTMDAICAHIAASRPASLRRCALLVREGGPAEDDPPDYAGLRVGPGFVVGYGLDHAERYRGLRDIRALPENGPPA